MDQKAVIDKYNEIDVDKSKTLDMEEFFKFSRIVLKQQIQKECKKRMLI